MNFSSRPNRYAERVRDVRTYQPDMKEEKKSTKREKRKIKKLYLFLLLLLLFGIIGSMSSIFFYKHYTTQYHHDVALANTGIKNLQTGISLIQALAKNPLDASSITHAKQAFATSNTSFEQLDTDLKSLPWDSTSIPVYGARLRTALKLAPIAVEMSQAGIVGCNALS